VTACVSQLRQIGLATFMYSDDYGSALPIADTPSGPSLIRTRGSYSLLILGNYLPGEKAEVPFCPDSYGRLRKPLYPNSYGKVTRAWLLANSAAGWMPGYFDLSFNQGVGAPGGGWSPYDGSNLPGTWSPRTSDARFNQRPLGCDQDFAYTNAGWPTAADPITWPAHGRNGGFLGANVLYGNGSVQWRNANAPGWLAVAFTGSQHMFPPRGD
jgi:hypothetical protein